jgi:hypothetical protein
MIGPMNRISGPSDLGGSKPKKLLISFIDSPIFVENVVSADLSQVPCELDYFVEGLTKPGSLKHFQ